MSARRAAARGAPGRSGADPEPRVRDGLNRRRREEGREQRARGRHHADGGRADGAGAVAEEVVEAEHVRPPRGRHRPRDDDLLDREERARLAGAHRDVADDRRGTTSGGHVEPSRSSADTADSAASASSGARGPQTLGRTPHRPREQRTAGQRERDRRRRCPWR